MGSRVEAGSREKRVKMKTDLSPAFWLRGAKAKAMRAALDAPRSAPQAPTEG